MTPCCPRVTWAPQRVKYEWTNAHFVHFHRGTSHWISVASPTKQKEGSLCRRLSLDSFLYSERGRAQFSVARGAASILPLHSVGNLVAMPRQQFGSTQIACFRMKEKRYALNQAQEIRENLKAQRYRLIPQFWQVWQCLPDLQDRPDQRSQPAQWFTKNRRQKYVQDLELGWKPWKA